MSEVERKLEEALNDARTALVRAEQARSTWEVRVQELQTEVAGLEAAVNRRRQMAVPTSAAPNTKTPGVEVLTGEVVSHGRVFGVPDWSMLPDLGPNGTAVVGVASIVMALLELHRNWQEKKRVAAVEAVLDVAQRPVHRGEITEALRRLGRTSDTLDHVSAALAHLNREARAHPVGGGYWSAGPVALEQGGE